MGSTDSDELGRRGDDDGLLLRVGHADRIVGWKAWRPRYSGRAKLKKNVPFLMDWSYPGHRLFTLSAIRRPLDAARRISLVCGARSFLGARSLFDSHASVSNIQAAGGRPRTRFVLLARDAKSRVEVDVDGLRPRLPDREKPAIPGLRRTAYINNRPRHEDDGADDPVTQSPPERRCDPRRQCDVVVRLCNLCIFAARPHSRNCPRMRQSPPTLTGFLGASIRKLNDAGSFPIN
jgi:hypothetical protein